MSGGDPSSSGYAYRGFLFADLRGYTADVERHGDRAAATLLDAYRELVRAQVSRHDGAEIKTEGDSFYVVFPSAQDAVRCALDIQSSSRDFNAESPHIPIRVGIGVHAGEVVEGSEGFVGAAVNVAARICGLAGAGDVLISRTVRDLTRSGLMLATQSRGSHRLKGITEPIELFAIRDQAIKPPAAHRRRLIGSSSAGITGAALIVTLAALAVAVVMGQRLFGSGLTLAPSDSQGPDGSAASTSSALSASATPSATIDPTVFPNADETALLDRLDPDLAEACRRANPDEIPRISRIGIHGGPEYMPMPLIAGLRCELVLSEQPDVVYIWHATEHYRDLVVDAFFRLTSVGSVPPGDCAVEDRAYGRWEFGQWSGRVACTVSNDDARIIWTYDDERVMGIAVRNDSDNRALYGWWREHARLLSPG